MTVRDAETESLIRSFANPLFRAAGVDPALVRITILQAWAINAFVAPGNRMFIHTGLIQRSDSGAEFAGVLAHETGHIAAQHLARLPEQLRAAMVRSVVAMLLGGAAAATGGRGGGDAGAALMLGGQNLAMRELFSFTRTQEQAADQAGITFLRRVGWTARGMERLLLRLQEQESLIASRQDPYTLTHPMSRDRLLFAREQIAQDPGSDRPIPAALEAGYTMVRAKLDGFLDNPRTTLRRYAPEDRSAPARYARAIAEYRLAHTREAVQLLDELIREQASNPYLHEMQGQVLFEAGRPRDALMPLRRAARLAPQEPLIRLALGRALIALEEPAAYAEAVRELDASLARERDSAFTWSQMAMAQGRLGHTALADLALAEAAMLEGEIPRVRMLAERALRALPPGPSRLRAQDLAHATERENMSDEDRRAEERARRRR